MSQKFLPSKYQIDIFDEIKNGISNLVVSAVAGSGKTTTLLEALKIINPNKKVLFLAFNKSINNELKKKVPQRNTITVKTVHGFGFLTLKKRKSDITLVESKYRILLKNIFDYNNTQNLKFIKKYNFSNDSKAIIGLIKYHMKDREFDFTDYKKSVVDLCNLGRLHFININDKINGVNKLKELSNIHIINNQDNECEVAWYLIKLGMEYIDEIDFTDMIFLPNILNLETDKFDIVFIDESQDLNKCQRLLMLKAINPNGGKFIAVGDPQQAIYAFAGADHESYKKLCDIPNTKELPLSITYRCHKQIVDTVKHINPDIIEFDGNNKGEVVENCSYKDVKDGDMILCRQTLPVVSLCIKYLSQGKKAHIIGSDIGMSLVNMIKKCERKTEDFTMENVFSRLYNDFDKQVQKIINNNSLTEKEALNDPYIVTYNEKIQAIDIITRKTTDPFEVINKIKEIFSSENGHGITLSTIHKAKGLESNRVFILQPELMPSKRAVLDWQRSQEENLFYVAYTRAKTYLGFIRDYNAFRNLDEQSRRDSLKKVKESKHVGIIGTKEFLKLKIVDINMRKGFDGLVKPVYDLIDRNGNVFQKWGKISSSFLINNHEIEVKKDSEVEFYAKINNHREFNGTKITSIGRLFHY